MSIQIIDGFQVNTASPIDNRIVASGSAARNAIPYKYEGLRVFDTSDSVPYVYVNGAWQSENASGISGAGTINYLPVYTSGNVLGNSLLYQTGYPTFLIKTVNTGSGADKVIINASTGLVTAVNFSGSGANITGIAGSNINNGSIIVNGSNSKLENGSTGQVLVSGVTNPSWTNQSQLSVGTASNAINSVISNTSTSSSTHYLTFVASGAWNSPLGVGIAPIRGNTNDLSYNPSTKILTATRINYSGGSLASATASKITFLNLVSNASTNVSNLEFSNVRNSVGSDWLTSGYRIQAKVDSQYLSYIQFNGDGNDSGISIGTGYQGSDSTSEDNKRMSISSFGDVIINSKNPYTSDALKITNTTVGATPSVARISIQASQPVITLRSELGTEKWSIYRKSTDDNLTFYNGSVDKLVLQSGGTLRAAADNSSALGTTSIRFTQVCAVNGTIQTSDLREKKDIQTSNLGLEFITKLKPVSYKWKVGHNNVTAVEDGVNENGELKYKQVITPVEGKRTHYGLIAQEVKEVLGDIDFGGFIHDDESDVMGLRYDQFISPLIKAIQEQQAQIEELKSKIK